ncbi:MULTISPECIES: hypothetical protein [Streptomyces]|uniref:Uncharacterized protein n=1 Tax=Streptomyces venezuelae TaxID=54571 RepID=A0A5P2B1F2_STRVZ|nr:hypothetical protein [Streptomyces venezuelae]QES24275.1 hypothetical protein DEJ46_38600 [Streptomyces venezuelae]
MVFIEPAETQAGALTVEQAARLDAALSVIAEALADVKQHATASALRDYRRDGIRVIFYATVLGSILIVTYVEVDDSVEST